MEMWIWIGGALIVGVVLGAVGALLTLRRRRGDAGKADSIRREFEGYKEEVNDHFVQTTELVNNLTHSYKAVYDHLEQGAYRLVGEEALRKQLGNVDSESVKLEYIGRRERSAVLGVNSSEDTQTEESPVR
ncbi:MAG: DUF1043 family protein [Trueperaceae bacterium]